MFRIATDNTDYDLYDVLNLSSDATTDEIRAAFRDMSRLYHPDKQAGIEANDIPEASSGREVAFHRVHRAYRVLGDEVLRKFYDRYGSVGVRLAETLSDEEEDDAFSPRATGSDAGDAESPTGGKARPRASSAGSLVLPDDRLHRLEERVRGLVRKHEELRVQRLLSLQGSFTLGAASAPGYHAAHLRHRYRLQYCAHSQSVQIALGGGVRLTLGCSSHVQGSNGLGVSRVTLGASAPAGPSNTVRASLGMSGEAPEADITVMRALSQHSSAQQRVAVSGEGAKMSFNLQCWVARQYRGTLSCAVAKDPSLQLSMDRRSLSCAHSVRTALSLQPGGLAELGARLKYKPCADFSVKLEPAVGVLGVSLQAVCSQAFRDGMTKLQWGIRLRPRGVTLRLGMQRAGLRFVFPLELWSEAVAGLAVLAARYGDPDLAGVEGGGAGVVDVTDCLMARVRNSRLHLSNAPKSTLLGFVDPRPAAQAQERPPVLFIRYRFGQTERERVFGDTDVVLLP